MPEPGDGTRSCARTLQAVVDDGPQGRGGRLPREGGAGLVEELEEVGRHDRARLRHGRFELREAGHEDLLGPLVAGLPEVREGLLDEGQGQRRLREAEEEVDLGLGRSLGGPRDLPKDVEEVPEKVPVGLARRKRRGNGELLQRRVARGGAVHLEEGEEEPAPVALPLLAKGVEEPVGTQRGEEVEDGLQAEVVLGLLGVGAHPGRVERLVRAGAHRLGDRLLDPFPSDHLLGEAEQGHGPPEVSLVELLDPGLDHLAEALRPLLGVRARG